MKMKDMEIDSELDELRNEQSELLEKQRKDRRKCVWALASAIATSIIAGLLMIAMLVYPELSGLSTVAGTAALITFSGFVLFCWISITSCVALSDDVKKQKLQISVLEEKQFFYDVNNLSSTEKAHKFLMAQNSRLREYEATHILHMKRIYWLGFTVIIAGIVIIAISAVVLFTAENEWYFPALGVLAGLLVDGFGAIVIAMYTKAVESTSALHKDMNTMLYAYLANMITSQVEDAPLRERTLAEIAQELAKHF